ncbi:MAG: cbb3-type cytochrome oxidase assembly protein CcoS [Chlorobium phaeobacteroides]|uniref:Cytochrome oxidase maturation protein, cbb3-type n=1 Tax=Chlorobium phaeobacteroides (strain BS1) TaxID=331678 RepID=B3EK70_CHLPB|nr:cbb3-type cytochrome oxidase assembly protein CcoS [Chlorobium phaeobacteroides]MBL6956713.1 cbb3-type cytochrome oxidase assembly protein CcoS [Chlorobium phaeobacteroides]
MYSTYFLIFIVFFLGFAAWLLFVWAVKSGQFEDPEAPKYRMLDDDDDVKSKESRSRNKNK